MKIDCPVCGTSWEQEQLQFYTAAKVVRLENGRDVGFNLGYRLFEFGDRLEWFPKDDPQYPLWRKGLDRDYADRDGGEEWLPVTCPDCQSDLLVVIGIESLFIVGVLDVVQANKGAR